MGSHKSESGRIASLDILRLLACAAVLWIHAGENMVVGWMLDVRPYIVDWRIGALAVNTFFVLSGFVICKSLLRDRGQGKPIAAFYTKRFARLMPPYFLLLSIYAWLGWAPSLTWGHWTYCFNFILVADPRTAYPQAHLWSLGIEEQWYLLFPWLVYLLADAKARKAITWVLLPAGVLVVAAMHEWRDGVDKFSTSFILALGTGALLAYHEAWTRSRGAAWLAVALIPLGLPFCRFHLPFSTYRLDPLAWWAGQNALCVGIVLACLSVVEPAIGRWAPRLRSRWLTHLGCMTYAVYLWHLLAYISVIRLVGRHWYTLPLGLAATLLLAMASYWLLERPLTAWAGRRFRASNNRAVWHPSSAPTSTFAAPQPIPVPIS